MTLFLEKSRIKIKQFLSFPIRLVRMLNKIGVKNYFLYQRAKIGEHVLLRLNNYLICVRKGTPDLGVAVSCLIDGEFDVISKHLNRSFDGVIIDAGGYIGTAALAFSKMFPHAQVISIEPSEANFEILRANTVGVKNIRAVYGALVGKEIGEIELRDRGTGMSGFTIVEKPSNNFSANILHKTPAFTIGQLVLNLSDIGILKLDIEGGELDLFVNDAKTLREIKIIVAELHNRIAPGCTQAFNDFSSSRLTFVDAGEKYFSVKKS